MTSPPREPETSQPSQRSKLVVLRQGAKIYEAARAMEDNHVGAVLVTDGHRLVGIVTDRDLALSLARSEVDPREIPLADVMTDVVGTCNEKARIADILCTMKQFACRRVPLTRLGRPVAIVTFDDLLLQGAASLEDLREIIEAQLGLPSRHKPAGCIRPVTSTESASSRRPVRRREARAEEAYRRLVREVVRCSGIGSKERAEVALLIVLAMLCRRLHPDDARGLSRGLPAYVREQLIEVAEAPAEPVTVDTIADELRSRLALPPDVVVDILVSIGNTVAEGTMFAEGGRLRWYIRELFPRCSLSLRPGSTSPTHG